MQLKDFDYYLPPERIAQQPLEKRDHSRLMVLNRTLHTIEHRTFFELVDYCSPGDILVVNDSKVIPARIKGEKSTGGKIELLLLHPERNGTVDETIWHCLVKCHKKPKPHTAILLSEELTAEILEEEEEGYKVKFYCEGSFTKVLDRIGTTPLPPYIKRGNGNPQNERSDRERYQTIFACNRGSVAAPTAGLHFTSELLEKLKAKGVTILPLTLHVGWGTFQPVRSNQVEKHQMHPEYYVLDSSTAQLINAARKRKARIISVGTTTLRTLEHASNEEGTLLPGKGYTNLFIYPGYRFKVVDSLITNFHLPRSTLLMLAAAFAGRDFLLKAYQKAIEKGYRFYSYGDAMLIL